MLKSLASLLGAALLLGACAPAPQQAVMAPPTAPAVQAPSFMVFFDWDRSDLSAQAMSTIQQAAAAYKSNSGARITAIGHTDTSGSPKYNAKLSERRAKAVADALVGAGVQATTLAVDWKGESEPAVATGDGVKEPLNRRSTISINF